MSCTNKRSVKTYRYAVLLILATLALTSRNGFAAKGPPPAIVKVATVVEKMIAPTTWVPGTVISRNDARLAAEVVGRLIKVADVGTLFKKGDVIARIEDTTFRLLLAEAKVRVVREKSKLKYLEREVVRLEELSKLNSAAKKALDVALSDRDITKSELDVAHVQVKQAEEQQSRTRIRAPFPGVVTERVLRTGERVDRGDIVVRFVDTESLEVQASVPHSSISHIARGSVLNIQIGPQLVPATVRTVVPVGDDQSRLFDIRLDIEGASLAVGRVLKVAVPTAQARRAIVVPRDALVLRRNGASVFRVMDDNSTERVAVMTGIADGPFIEVIGDIKAGQRVVVRGGERLRPGQKVKIMAEGAR